jgi:hypothetical protein
VRSRSDIRNYDPTTDQFLSIDPDVATTDQPYVFTNDNPLNATDPLGLSGGPVVFGRPCKKNCGPSPLEIVNTIISATSRAYTTANNFANHVVIGFGGCIGVCANVALQGTTLTLSFGGFGLVEKGPYAGYSNLLPSQRQQTQVFISGGAGVGGSAETGVKPNGSIDHSDWEADGGQVSGIGGGLLWSKSIILWP